MATLYPLSPIEDYKNKIFKSFKRKKPLKTLISLNPPLVWGGGYKVAMVAKGYI